MDMHEIPFFTSWGENAKSCAEDLLTLSTLSALWIDNDSEHIATQAAQALAASDEACGGQRAELRPNDLVVQP